MLRTYGGLDSLHGNYAMPEYLNNYPPETNV